MTAPQDAVDWSTPEVVRAVNRLSTSLDSLEESVKTMPESFDRKYVTREIHEASNALHKAALSLVTARVKVLEDARAIGGTWVRDLVAPVITGLTVGLLVFLLTHGLKG